MLTYSHIMNTKEEYSAKTNEFKKEFIEFISRNPIKCTKNIFGDGKLTTEKCNANELLTSLRESLMSDINDITKIIKSLSDELGGEMDDLKLSEDDVTYEVSNDENDNGSENYMISRVIKSSDINITSSYFEYNVDGNDRKCFGNKFEAGGIFQVRNKTCIHGSNEIFSEAGIMVLMMGEGTDITIKFESKE